MVEFAIVAPIGFLLILGVVIFGLMEMNQVQLSNLARDSARSGALCGSAGRSSNSQLPNGTSCSWGNLQSYVTGRLGGLVSGSPTKPATGSFGSNCDTSGTVIYCVWTSTHAAVSISGSNPLDACVLGDELQVVTQFDQQLYIPLVGRFFGGTGTTKSLSADAYAECEQ